MTNICNSGIKNENGDDNKSLTMYVKIFAHCAEGFYLSNSALRTNPNPLLVMVILFFVFFLFLCRGFYTLRRPIANAMITVHSIPIQHLDLYNAPEGTKWL